MAPQEIGSTKRMKSQTWLRLFRKTQEQSLNLDKFVALVFEIQFSFDDLT